MVANNQGYIGQYGDSLRRLTALSSQNAGPQNMGGADALGQQPTPAGALAQAPGGAGPDMGNGQPALGGQPSGAGALTPPPQGAAPGGMGMPSGDAATAAPTSGISLKELMSNASSAHKDHAVQTLKDKGVNINDSYDYVKKNGYVPQDEKLSTRDKGLRLLTFGLMMTQAASRGMNPVQSAAWAGSSLLAGIVQDKQQKEALSNNAAHEDLLYQREKAEKEAERASRTSDVNAEIVGRRTVAEGETAGRKAVAEGESASRERIALIEAKARLLAAKVEAKRSNKPMQYVDEKGTVKLVTAKDDGTYEVSTPAEDVVTTQTRPGKGRNAMPEQVDIHTPTPIKPRQKLTSADSLTPGEIETAIGKEKERLGKDLALGSSLRNAGLTGDAKDKELERMARERVMGRQTQSGGDDGNDPAQVRGN